MSMDSWWVKYRHNFANSNSEWEWFFSGDSCDSCDKSEVEEFVKEYLIERWRDENSHNYDYLGTDFEVVSDVPEDVVAQQLSGINTVLCDRGEVPGVPLEQVYKMKDQLSVILDKKIGSRS